MPSPPINFCLTGSGLPDPPVHLLVGVRITVFVHKVVGKDQFRMGQPFDPDGQHTHFGAAHRQLVAFERVASCGRFPVGIARGFVPLGQLSIRAELYPGIIPVGIAPFFVPDVFLSIIVFRGFLRAEQGASR